MADELLPLGAETYIGEDFIFAERMRQTPAGIFPSKTTPGVRYNTIIPGDRATPGRLNWEGMKLQRMKKMKEQLRGITGAPFANV